MYLVNGGSQKTSSSHSCDSHAAFSPPSGLAGGRCPKTFEERLPHPVGRGVRDGRHALQKLPQSSARFGLSAVPPQAGPTRSRPAPARKQENRRLRSRRRGRCVRSPRRHENRRTGDCEAADGVDAFEARAGKKTGEQEGAEPQAEPTRPRSAPARKQENRKYFTEVPYASCSPVFGTARGGSACLLSSCFPARRAEAPHASCSHVFGMARGGSPCLLFSCFWHGARRLPMPPVLMFLAWRAEAPHASCSPVFDLITRAGGRRAIQARGPSARGRAPAAQRRDAGARAEGAARAGARRFARARGAAPNALQKNPRSSARSVPSPVPSKAGAAVSRRRLRRGWGGE